ncbi:uncharacterized protein LOC125205365 isoform X4 [Salvia hispanica]|uniref:uncharacterized protein LOC125205365 isoform X4 n=1 Tax=Salvia hispanica TaxID=49212 RepID=UPI002009B59D|nr:uncharacterized protein LOC125205365 isoform X4 [Salvia hispanica]
MEKGTASARKPPLPPRRQRIDEKPSPAAAGKPSLPPRRQRIDEKASAAARNPPLPLRRKRVDDESSKSPLPPRQRKSSETSNRAWIADQLRSDGRFVKISSKICVSMVRDLYNVRADWPDEFNVDLALYLIAKVVIQVDL